MLARKGYPAGLAFRVVKEAMDRPGRLGRVAGDPDVDGYDLDDVFGPDTAADALAGDEWTGGDLRRRSAGQRHACPNRYLALNLKAARC